jgi:hypothetical protein
MRETSQTGAGSGRSRVGRWIFGAGVTVTLVLFPCVVAAGTIKLAWDPVGDTDLAGYRVYYGTTPGVYSQTEDVGKNETVITLKALQDCKVYYLALKAVDANGLESISFSNEISGMSAPTLSQVINASDTTSSGQQGTASLNVTLYGANFDKAKPSFVREARLTDVSCTSSANCTGPYMLGCDRTSSMCAEESFRLTSRECSSDQDCIAAGMVRCEQRPSGQFCSEKWPQDVFVNSYGTVSCNEIWANITIDEAAGVNYDQATGAVNPGLKRRVIALVNEDGSGPSGNNFGLFNVLFDERRADIDGSGKVAARDLLYWQTALGSIAGDPGYNINADLNGDGIVDGADLTLLAVWHGTEFF